MLEVLYKRIKLANFSTKKEEYQNLLFIFGQEFRRKKSLASMFAETHRLADVLSKTEDKGLRFLASLLRLLVSESELIRFHISEAGVSGGELEPEVTKALQEYMSSLASFYAASDLPLAFDFGTRVYVKLYGKALQNVFEERKKIGNELIKAGSLLKDTPPRLKPIYEFFMNYGRKIVNVNPTLSLALIYTQKFFIEKLYASRPFLTRAQYRKICKHFGENFIRIGKAIKKEDKISLYNYLFNLFTENCESGSLN